MSLLYLCRHAETISNRDGWLAGQWNVPLTDRGLKHARLLAEQLHAGGAAGMGAVLTSDLARSVCTAQPVAEKLGLTIIQDARLRERDYGEWTGRERTELETKHPREWNYRHSDPDFTPPGGESLQQHRTRAVEALEETLLDYPAGLVLITHWGTTWCILEHLRDGSGGEVVLPLSPPEFLRVWWGNGEAKKIGV